IISELMDFAKPMAPKPQDSDLAQIAQRAMQNAKAHNKDADTTVEATFTDMPPVTVDPQQVTDAVSEVIDNAFQSIEEGRGLITLHGAFDPFSQRVVLTITDNGCGMDEATLKRAFDPFYSSKPAGRRRGMGLPKAMRWIESSGGSIRLESTP